MQDTDIFRRLLGLNEEWEVSSVELDEKADSIELHVQHLGKAHCPVCGKVSRIHDYSDERRWRHLDTMQFKTYVACRVPRCDCSEHGVKQILVPWSGPHSRFTALFESLAIDLLRMTKCQSRTGKILRLNPWQVHDIMRRAVDRGLERRKLGMIHHLSIDEKSYQHHHKYGCVLTDLAGRRVLDLVEGRDEKAARSLLGGLPYPEAVKTITMDLAPAYRSAAYEEIPKADVIHDRFHLAMNLNLALDKVRKAELKTHPELKDTKYVWLKNPDKRTHRQEATFQELVTKELETAKAYALKELFKHFFEQKTVRKGAKFLGEWLSAVNESGMKPMIACAKTIDERFIGLLNYIKWKTSNGYAECLNSMIQEITTVARGFRRFENFRIAVLFFLGKLSLYPQKSP